MRGKSKRRAMSILITMLLCNSTVERSNGQIPRTSAWFDLAYATYPDNGWYAHFRVSRGTFEFFVEELQPYLKGKETQMRKPVEVRRKVGLLLYFIATRHISILANTRSKYVSDKFSDKSSEPANISLETVRELLQVQESTMKSFFTSFVNSTNNRLDQSIRELQDVKTSLEFTQRQVDELIKFSTTDAVERSDFENKIENFRYKTDDLYGKVDAEIVHAEIISASLEFLNNQMNHGVTLKLKLLKSLKTSFRLRISASKEPIASAAGEFQPIIASPGWWLPNF